MTLRSLAQSPLDWLQTRVDLFPFLPYQTLPQIGLKNGRRGLGTQERWSAIWAQVDGAHVRSAMDIGCNVGFFCLGLAGKGIPTLGVDFEPRLLRIARMAAARLKARRLAFTHLLVDDETVCLLPTVDLTLLLSVWHHWVRYNGLTAATNLLERVWQKTQWGLVFETGEREMPASFRLPDMGENPSQWIGDYLRRTCTGGEILWLGRFKAFAPGGDEARLIVERNMFLVRRTR